MFRPRALRRAERHLASADPVLAGIIKQAGPCRFNHRPGGFHTLAEIIIHQQLSTVVAVRIFARLKRLAKCSRLSAVSIERLSDDALRGVGVSPQKIRYLRDLVDKVRARSLPLSRLHALRDEDVVAALITVKGLGRWSAEMYLMFTLGRVDLFSSGDNGLQTAVRNLYGVDGKPSNLEKFAERWKPYRTIACWYLWQSLQLK